MNWNEKADRYARVARMLRYALTLRDHNAWVALTAVLIARLTAAERTALAFAALKSLNAEHATLTANAAIKGTVSERGE